MVTLTTLPRGIIARAAAASTFEPVEMAIIMDGVAVALSPILFVTALQSMCCCVQKEEYNGRGIVGETFEGSPSL